MTPFRSLLTLSFLLMLSASVTAQTDRFSAPVLITSAGQSADVTMAGMLCKKAGIAATVNAKAAAGDLGDAKTLIIVPGFSSKGLGAAGISREQEMERVTELLAAAKAKKVKVMMLHLGGKPRRGAQSDDFNKASAEASAAMIVVKQGDEDGFFSTLAASKKIPIELVEKIAEAVKPLGAKFQ